MESFGSFGLNDISRTVRKKRSNSYRRPRNDPQSGSSYRDNSSLSSTPPSDDVSKALSDDNIGYGTSSQKKELNLNQCSSKASSTNLTEAETSLKISNEDGGVGESSEAYMKGSIDHGVYSESFLSQNNLKSTKKVVEGLELQSRAIDDQISERTNASECSRQSVVASSVLGNENKPRKVKLKVGGVTHTINPTSAVDAVSVGGSSSNKSSRSSDAPYPQQKRSHQDNSDEDHSPSANRGNNLRGVPWKDFSRSGFSVNKMDASSAKMSKESIFIKQSNNESVRKSKRVPKIRLLSGEFDDGDDDDEEIRYLEKLKTSKLAADYRAEFEDEDGAGSRKQRKISRMLKGNVVPGYNFNAYGSSRSGKEGKKSRSGRMNEDTDYVEEEELFSDGEPEIKRKKQRTEFMDMPGDSKREMAVTTRQRALQTGKAISSTGASLVEFPNGLPPVPSRKQKEKLSEVEQQLKKAEAAQRRKMQVEKAARESEAEAIRKILGQDSSRKKREDKVKKRKEELAQEKAANSMAFTSNTVRWVMNPAGTVVTFPTELGLPSIFDTKPCSYPPPREKCAGPSCTNPYKYRDSKSKLPLCSLQCYKAVHEKIQAVTSC